MTDRQRTLLVVSSRVIAGACSLITMGLAIHAVVVATSPGVPPGRVWLVRWAYLGGVAAIFSWRAVRGKGVLTFVFGILTAAWLFDSAGLVSGMLVLLALLCLLAIGIEYLKSRAAEPRVADRATPGR